MNKFISNIQTLNFKTIRNYDITNCSRINLFIGRPNVGKSNIIEALSLFSTPYYKKTYLKANKYNVNISELLS